jgi:hypothetical protein
MFHALHTAGGDFIAWTVSNHGFTTSQSQSVAPVLCFKKTVL